MKKNKFKSVSKVTIGVYVLAVLMGGIALYNPELFMTIQKKLWTN